RLVIERSRLTRIPLSLVTGRNVTELLSFAGDWLEEVPAEVLELCCAPLLLLGGNPQLQHSPYRGHVPDTASSSDGPAAEGPTVPAIEQRVVDLSDSNISVLPAWMTFEFLMTSQYMVVLAGSPFCTTLMQ